MIKKTYKLIIILICLVLCAAWVVFLDAHRSQEIKAATQELEIAAEKEAEEAREAAKKAEEEAKAKAEAEAKAKAEAEAAAEAKRLQEEAAKKAEESEKKEDDRAGSSDTIKDEDRVDGYTAGFTTAGDSPDFKFDYVVPNVSQFVNIRRTPSKEGDIAGLLIAGSYGLIIERAEGWTRIKSGDITGWVINERLFFDREAVEKLEAGNSMYITVKADKLNMYSGPGNNYTIYEKTTNGMSYPYRPEDSVDGWYAVSYEDRTGYLFAENCEIEIMLETAKKVGEDY